MALNGSVSPSGNFDLTNWKLTLPVDRSGSYSGTAREIIDLIGYQHETYFYTAADGAMTFAAPVQGATTSGSNYARSELREMNGTARAAWTLEQGGFMAATLEVDRVPLKSDGTAGRIIVGQIHGQDDELVRLYWEGGKLYFANDRSGTNNTEGKFYFANTTGEQPNVSFNERFSYTVNVIGDDLEVTVLADGQTYRSVSRINDAWDTDTFYFKAGAYLGVNEAQGTGWGQTSFYALSFNHDGTAAQPPAPTPPPPPPSTNAGVNRTGTSSNDRLTGGVGNDTLDGAGGADTMQGGAGDDIYHVGSTGDRVVETVNGGTDRVIATISWTLPAEAEHLDLRGSAGWGKGNGLANRIVGNESANNLLGSAGDDTLVAAGGKDTLDGGAGRDVMQGGAGADTYLVDSAGDALTESHDAGTDTVKSSVSWTLGDAFEKMYLVGQAHITGSGNALSNRIAGNSGNNQLVGHAGNDSLIGETGNDQVRGGIGDDYISGGGGDDTLAGGNGLDRASGGSGADRFLFESPHDGRDTITDFVHGADLLQFVEANFATGLRTFSGTLNPGNFAANVGGRTTSTHGQFCYDTSTGALSWDGDGIGSGGPVALVVLANKAAIAANDFTFV